MAKEEIKPKEVNPGYFVFHAPISKDESNIDRVKAELRLKFSHHLDRFFESLNRAKNDKH